ncbi:MAG: endonuclease/exonuclease/phosphatase family protein [Geminicoccaceae bacterium]
MRARPPLRHLLDAALAAAALGTAAPWLAGASTVADLLGQFLQQVALLTLALALLTWLTRQRLRALVAAALLALQLVVLRPDLDSIGAAADGAPARVLFFNVWARNGSREETLDYIRRSDADVVVLAEVTEGWPALIDRLADAYPWRVDCLGHSGCDVVLLARSRPLAAHGERDEASGAPYVEARLRLAGHAVTIAGSHLTRPVLDGDPVRQRRQAAFLADRLGAIAGPRLLVGDFNAVPWGAVGSILRRGSGLEPASGATGSWPSPLPGALRIPIDLALASPDLAGSVRRVGPWLGSDHRPIMVELKGLHSG